MASVETIHVLDVWGIGISQQYRFCGKPKIKYGKIIKVRGKTVFGTETELHFERSRITSFVLTEIE